MNFLSIPITLDTTTQKDEDNHIIPRETKNIFLSFIPFKDNQEANNTIAQKLQLTTQDLYRGIIQLTGRSDYNAFQTYYNNNNSNDKKDFLNNEEHRKELVTNGRIALLSAVIFVKLQ